MKILAQYRGASFHYTWTEKIEAGLVLTGSEVKSLRLNRASLQESYVVHDQGELFLHHMRVAPYSPASHFAHSAERPRKLLVHRRQIRSFVGAVTRQGMTIIPLRLYVNNKGWIKLEIALAKGKKKEDQRQSIKEKEWKRQQHRVLKTSLH